MHYVPLPLGQQGVYVPSAHLPNFLVPCSPVRVLAKACSQHGSEQGASGTNVSQSYGALHSYVSLLHLTRELMLCLSQEGIGQWNECCLGQAESRASKLTKWLACFWEQELHIFRNPEEAPSCKKFLANSLCSQEHAYLPAGFRLGAEQLLPALSLFLPKT